MIAWLARLLKWLPGVGRVLEKLAAGGDRVREIRAQTEHDDIEGFHRTGRVSAAHAWKYAKVAIAALLAVAFIAMLFFPHAAENAVVLLEGFAGAVGRLFALDL